MVAKVATIGVSRSPSGRVACTNGLIHVLETEWPDLQPTVAMALQRWAIGYPILTVTNLEPGHHVTLSNDDTDRFLHALLTYATDTRTDDGRLAARIVLQLMLPSATRLSGRLPSGSRADREAAIIATMYEVITSYPVTRRPSHVAANLTYDTWHRCYVERERVNATVPVSTAPDRLDPDPRPTSSSEELARLLTWAVRRGILTSGQAQLLSEGTAYGQTAVLARRLGVTPCAVRQRRRHALAKLRAAIDSYDGLAA